MTALKLEKAPFDVNTLEVVERVEFSDGESPVCCGERVDVDWYNRKIWTCPHCQAIFVPPACDPVV